MKKEVYLLFIIVGILALSTVNGGIFDFFKSPVTGKASSQDTSLSITVIAPLPTLTIISPTSTTYSTNSILLNYTTVNAETVWYSLDGASNITVSSSVTLTISDGSHNLFLYANNSEGNINWTNVSFSVVTSSGGSTSGGGGGGGGSTPKKEEKSPTVNEKTIEEQKKASLDSDYLLLELEYDKGDINLIEKSFEKGNLPTLSHEIEKEFKIEMISNNREILYSSFFNNPGLLYSDDFSRGTLDVGGMIELNKVKFYLTIPVSEDMDKIKILRKKEIVLEEYVYS